VCLARASGQVDVFEFIRLYDLVKQGSVVGLAKGTASLFSSAQSTREAKFKEALQVDDLNRAAFFRFLCTGDKSTPLLLPCYFKTLQTLMCFPVDKTS
jgi:hypothetical protein